MSGRGEGEFLEANGLRGIARIIGNTRREHVLVIAIQATNQRAFSDFYRNWQITVSPAYRVQLHLGLPGNDC